MNKIFHILLLIIIVAIAQTSSTVAGESAQTVRTSGNGEIEKITNRLIFSSSKKFAVKIPGVISAGETIPIQYVDSGKTISSNFAVLDIAKRGDLCWLHSKRNNQNDLSLGETIYVQPCQKLQ